MLLFKTLVAGLLPLAAALPPITRTGKYLYDDKGDRFFIKGVAYQPQGRLAVQTQDNAAHGGFPEPDSYIDPLSSKDNCTRDLPHLQKLGVNAVRVYSVDPNKNHDDCMKLFDDNGIYVLLDLSLPANGSINRAAPTWTTALLDEYMRTIDSFNKYDNVLAYSVGNEVISRAINTDAAPFVKAAARDIKAYLRSIGSNAMVSYSAVDGDSNFRGGVAEYLTCGNDSVTVDLYGLNNYAWCGQSSVTASTWSNMVADFSNVPVATYMSEYGCNKVEPRPWQEVDALYSDPTVTNVFSGGVAFSYFPTSDGYGMVEFGSDGKDVTESQDFLNLAAHLKNVTTSTTPTKAEAQTGSIECPADNARINASGKLPPTPDKAACTCVNDKALSCHVISATANNPAKLGALTDYACSLLGQANASSVTCDNISGNGTTGVYGALSFCSPEVKLNYAMSSFWEIDQKDTSCDFGGNATLTPITPNTQASSEIAAKCLQNASAVTTPSATSGGPAQTTGVAPTAVATAKPDGSSNGNGGSGGGQSAGPSGGKDEGNKSNAQAVVASLGMVVLAVAGAVIAA